MWRNKTADRDKIKRDFLDSLPLVLKKNLIYFLLWIHLQQVFVTWEIWGLLVTKKNILFPFPYKKIDLLRTFRPGQFHSSTGRRSCVTPRAFTTQLPIKSCGWALYCTLFHIYYTTYVELQFLEKLTIS